MREWVVQKDGSKRQRQAGKNQEEKDQTSEPRRRAAASSGFFGKHEVKSRRVLPSSSPRSDGAGQARPQFHLPLEGNPDSEAGLNCISF
jgi:hypothetical protein